MATLLGALLVSLGLDSGQFRSGLSEADKQLRQTQKNFERIGGNLQKVGAVMTVGITAPFTALISQAIPAARESQQAVGQVNAALASMGPVAGRTTEQLQDAATALMHISTFDDDEILRKVTANMLTFGSIAGEQFDRAQRAAVDLSTRMNGDLQASTILIGKALNDPIKGMGALRKVGIQLTDQQKEQVKGFVASGNAAGAQRVILGELEHQFKGSAKAMRDATPGADLKNAWDDFQETIGGIALKVLPPLTSGLASVLDKFNQLSPQVQATAVGAAAVLAVMGPLLGGFGTLIRFSAPIVANLAGIGAGMIGVGAAGETAAVGAYSFGFALGAAIAPALPIIAAVAGAAALGYAAWEHWDTIAPILSSVGQAIQNVLGPPLLRIVGAAKGAVSELWSGPFGDLMRSAFDKLQAGFALAKVALAEFGNAVAPIIDAIGRFVGATARFLGAAFLADLKAFGSVVGAAFHVVGDAINAVAALFQGRWGEAWSYAKKAATDAIGGLVNGVKALLTGPLGTVLNWVEDKLRLVGDAFYHLYDRVVGHSYIPDLVDEIGVHMARLDANLTQPVKAATSKAAEAFRQLQEDVKPILDRLFPDQAALNTYRTELGKIAAAAKAGILTPAQAEEADRRLRNDARGADPGFMPEGIAEPFVGVWNAADHTGELISDTWRKVAAANDNLGESFAQTTRNITSSLQGLMGNIKSGDWLGALSGVADLFTQLAGGGLFGKKAQASAASFRNFGGGRALGGAVMPRTDYLVGERGPEILRLGAQGGAIVPNSQIGQAGAQTVVRLVVAANEMFDVRVAEGAARVIVEAAPALTERATAATVASLSRARM